MESGMKSLIELWTSALDDLSARCRVNSSRSLETVVERMAHEGDAFFHITLPAFGKDFEKSLARGWVSRDDFLGFSRNKYRGVFDLGAVAGLSTPDDVEFEVKVSGTPKFLGEFINRVFDPDSGLLREAVSSLDREEMADSVHAVRQLSHMFGKVRKDCTPARNESAISAYLRTDEEITATLDRISSLPNFWVDYIEPVKQAVRVLYGDVLSHMEKLIHEGEVVPKHGPGATADRLSGNAKFHQLEWTDRMEQLFHYVDYAVPNHRYAMEVLPRVKFLTPEQERPVKVVLVPKTVKTPRVIAIEPTCMQYMQQAVAGALVSALESPTLEMGRDNPASWFLGFTDQRPNQVLAQIGSEDGSLATLDLSEASDRVPNWLVEAMFEDWPWFSEAIQVTRSLRANVPGHGVVPLVKYASMGSALTFPIEAMVFLAIVWVGIANEQKRPITGGLIKRYREQVRIYGDDIIVPNDLALPVVRWLETFGFKVNKDKSFWSGSFRESCGKEYFHGLDVSIVKYREELPIRQALRKDDDADFAKSLQSTVSTRNQFYSAGMWKTASLLDGVLDYALRGHYPYVGEESSLLGRTSFTCDEPVTGWDVDLQRPLVRGYVGYNRLPVNPAEEWTALLKCLLQQHGDEPVTSSEHLYRSGRPRAVGIKLAKRPPV